MEGKLGVLLVLSLGEQTGCRRADWLPASFEALRLWHRGGVVTVVLVLLPSESESE